MRTSYPDYSHSSGKQEAILGENQVGNATNRKFWRTRVIKGANKGADLPGAWWVGCMPDAPGTNARIMAKKREGQERERSGRAPSMRSEIMPNAVSRGPNREKALVAA